MVVMSSGHRRTRFPTHSRRRDHMWFVCQRGSYLLIFVVRRQYFGPAKTAIEATEPRSRRRASRSRRQPEPFAAADDDDDADGRTDGAQALGERSIRVLVVVAVVVVCSPCLGGSPYKNTIRLILDAPLAY